MNFRSRSESDSPVASRERQEHPEGSGVGAERHAPRWWTWTRCLWWRRNASLVARIYCSTPQYSNRESSTFTTVNEVIRTNGAFVQISRQVNLWRPSFVIGHWSASFHVYQVGLDPKPSAVAHCWPLTASWRSRSNKRSVPLLEPVGMKRPDAAAASEKFRDDEANVLPTLH